MLLHIHVMYKVKENLMIDKTELLRMIMETNPGQSPAFVLEQYATYLKGLDNLHGACAPSLSSIQEMGDISQNNEVKKETKASLTCGYTKRMLKVKPENAITNDEILCCICGESRKALTSRHLATHNGITPEGYKKLCGYAQDQPLMSKRHFSGMKKNVQKAQMARKKKKSD